ncbi:MAG: late competence development ComFB family protein [Microcoleaceae cyanobacterium MO_207.B10]|nr:late competence development ComFB family protein [Microcoleaceae cyanobacterium MO_207.B10]
MPDSSTKKYLNIMEKMVAEEVNRQITQLPQKLAKYIKRVDVETYALNRLPPLYASSQEGWKFQTKRAQAEYKKQISTAVRHAFAAVQRDLLKHSTPLVKEEIRKASPSAKTASSTSQDNNKNLSWRHSQYYRLGSSR